MLYFARSMNNSIGEVMSVIMQSKIILPSLAMMYPNISRFYLHPK